MQKINFYKLKSYCRMPQFLLLFEFRICLPFFMTKTIKKKKTTNLFFLDFSNYLLRM